MFRSVTLTAAVIAVLLSNNATQAQTSAFRLETDVYVGSESKPVYQTFTLFKDGIAYDTPHESSTITVVDIHRNRIVLVDSARKVQTPVDLGQLIRLLNDARTQAGRMQPIVEEASQVAEQDGSVIVGGKTIRYQASMQDAPDRASAVAYAKFADAVAHLNGRLQEAALPYARLTLNREIAKRSKLPSEITKTVYLGEKPIVHRSKLHATWRLSDENEKRIAAINDMLTAFPIVSERDFFQPPVHAASVGGTTR